jgi:hypothetical protein
MSLDIWRRKLPLESEGGSQNMRVAQIDCTGSGLGYCPGSFPPGSWFPDLQEPKKARKGASDPLPCLVSPLVPGIMDFLQRFPDFLRRFPDFLRRLSLRSLAITGWFPAQGLKRILKDPGLASLSVGRPSVEASRSRRGHGHHHPESNSRLPAAADLGDSPPPRAGALPGVLCGLWSGGGGAGCPEPRLV